ncbi:hypothetical protein [Schaalia canis]|uniref:Uncharacterized protein n=1 Tax=Schaalia canis TaxID=100469 RepID=A0A3P1SCR0_9ACTO|nr:hypothetical protein [Schaalia canis]RRC94836.1 hypothetical protein EII11_08115 [Schaalia canis]
MTLPSPLLTAAQCEAGKATDNLMTVDKAQKHANYRFVATYDGKSISLKEELRNKLWAEGKLTASDIKAAYPTFVFDYTKPLMVQAYWFDAEKAYAPALYDTALKLTVGDSARFIKRGEAKTLTLVDPATLNCRALLSRMTTKLPRILRLRKSPRQTRRQRIRRAPRSSLRLPRLVSNPPCSLLLLSLLSVAERLP